MDDGDIIKRVGDYLILLRRGRLFGFGIGTDPGQVTALDFIDVEWPNEDIDAFARVVGSRLVSLPRKHFAPR